MGWWPLLWFVLPGLVLAFRRDRVLGCVVHASASTPEPGLVQHRMGQGLIVGEPRGGSGARAQAAVELLVHAAEGTLDQAEVQYDRRVALGVVMASSGYPDAPRKGDPINGLPAATAS